MLNEKTIRTFLFWICFIISVLMTVGQNAYAQSTLTKGHQILLDKGMQFSTIAFPNSFPYPYLKMNLWNDAGFTSIDLQIHSYGEYHYDYMTSYGLPSGENALQFRAWVYETDMDTKLCSEQYANNLVAVQLGDEQSIASSALAGIAANVAHLQEKYQNTLIYTNQAVGSSGYSICNGITLNMLKTYTHTVKPDMLNFTEYPFRWQDTSYPVQDYEGGSPKNMYVHMEMYRLAGLAGLDGTGSQPIPVGMYTQQFCQPTSTEVNHRQPTESEYRLQQFAGLAFGMKSFDAFIYNFYNPSVLKTIYFTSGQNPSADFYKLAEMTRQAKNLAPALVQLISTEVRMKMGRREDGQTNPLPVDSAAGVAVKAWNTTSDAYLKNISAVNLGTKNNAKEGDVIVGFFKPLHESLVEEGAENDVYFMVVNGLSDEAGSADECTQKIHLEFNFSGTDITQLLRLSRETGEVEIVSLEDEGEGFYSLDLILDGGTGDLFKYDTGTAFIPEPATIGIGILGLLGLLKRKR